MFERFTERARQVIVFAQQDARALRNNYIGTEHLLLGLVREDEGIAGRVLTDLGLTYEAALAPLPPGSEASTAGQLPFTPRAQKVIELSLREALSLGHNYIGTEHVLLALDREGNGVAARILRGAGIDSDPLRNAVINSMTRGPREPAQSPRSLALRDAMHHLEKLTDALRRLKDAEG